MKTRNLQYKLLTEVGEIIHKAKSGRLILKLFEMTKINAGDTILDSHGKKIGNVNELIGPVDSPYASVILLDENLEAKAGEKVFRFISKHPHRSFTKGFKRIHGQKLRRKK
jgi:rRNA processing protein Gar1